MVVYIKEGFLKQFVELEQELDSNLYSNIGITFADYESGMWVKLSESQKEFYLNNPNATVQEVWNTQLNSEEAQVNDLDKAKEDTIHTIELYDLSNAVNAFILNNVIKTWFSVEQRLNYKQSIESAKILKEDQLEFLIEGMVISISIDAAEYMLAQIQRYADKCYMVTEQHKANVKTLTNIEDVNNYDYTIGYPDMLKFELS